MLRKVAIAAAGTVIVAAFYVATASDPLPDTAPQIPFQAAVRPLVPAAGQRRVAARDPTRDPGAAAIAGLRRMEAEPVRDVTPSSITARPLPAGKIERIPPARPAATPAAADSGARTRTLFRPLIETAGGVRTGDRDIALAGIAAPGPAATCGAGETAWPCGRMARAALRRFVRNRALSCDLPAGATDIPDPARCRVAGTDLAQWLVERGWARAQDATYDDEQRAARDARRGIWAESRPGIQPDEAPEDLPEDPASGSGRASAEAISVRVSGMP